MCHAMKSVVHIFFNGILMFFSKILCREGGEGEATLVVIVVYWSILTCTTPGRTTTLKKCSLPYYHHKMGKQQQQQHHRHYLSRDPAPPGRGVREERERAKSKAKHLGRYQSTVINMTYGMKIYSQFSRITNVHRVFLLADAFLIAKWVY